MRKQILFAMLLLMGTAAMAQHHHARPIEKPVPAEKATLVLTASMGERFVVYVDGDLVNRTIHHALRLRPQVVSRHKKPFGI